MSSQMSSRPPKLIWEDVLPNLGGQWQPWRRLHTNVCTYCRIMINVHKYVCTDCDHIQANFFDGMNKENVLKNVESANEVPLTIPCLKYV